ncbi:MAG: aspartate aminotransferase family protein [Desulfomonilia bacterium]|jgi:predicted acetylornithine/succinylornithine family transaminase|nr:aspartate aminotransferase family protein [Deltaproteobacteria bacterium]MDX9760812.1 aspartate aminotransferase family protein [Desulfomonilia bacterium]
MKHVMNTYSRLPVTLVRGSGCRVWDDRGRSYLDMVAGIAVCNLGHAHPQVAQALKQQADELFHCSNLYRIPLQDDVARMISENSFESRVFFSNSGAEANEGAIKLVRRYCHGYSRRGPGIITFTGSFHGRTLATLTATGQEKFKKGFAPLPEGFRTMEFGDMDALREAVDDSIGAIMIEPVQGEGGVRIPPKGYLKNIRELCDEYGLLLVLDEVQTGMGRTGELFGYLHEEIRPDIMTLAKALANGFPVGAVAARPDVAEAFDPGSHASTFGGNPLAMAAASATLGIMIEQDIPGRCRETGAYLTQGLNEMMSLHSGIREIRARGLMIGIQCDADISSIPRDALEKGIMLNVIQGSVLRLVPPLIIARQECDEAVEKIDALLREKGV